MRMGSCSRNKNASVPFWAGRHREIHTPLSGRHFFSGSLIFWPTFRCFQSMSGLTAIKSATVQPFARAIRRPVSPPLTMYSPGPATALEAPCPWAAGLFWASSSLAIEACSVPIVLPTAVKASWVWRPKAATSLSALSAAAPRSWPARRCPRSCLSPPGRSPACAKFGSAYDGVAANDYCDRSEDHACNREDAVIFARNGIHD